MRGLGGKSCGPDPEEKYELHAHSFVFSFVISASNVNDALTLSKTDFGKGTKATSGTHAYVKPTTPRELVECKIEEDD